ncbi:MAG: HAD hydrolase-like protein [Bdellovibrionales bacterium]
MKKVKNVLFDIDGTLTDSAPGIIQAYTVVAKKMKVSAPSIDSLRDFIGSPLRGSLATFVPKGKVEEAVKHYYHCYDYMRIGLTQNRVQDGVIDALTKIKFSGKRLYIVTAKLKDFTLPILNLFELETFFQNVYAPEVGEPSDMCDQIRNALVCEKLDLSETVMVGDRRFDFDGANNNHIGFIGVSWGYGPRRELELCGAKYIVDTPEELADLLAG